MSDSLSETVPGYAALLQWFGYMPSFHDAEVLDLTFDHESANATFRLHAFEMTSEVDSHGYFVLNKHVVVTFALSEITSIERGKLEVAILDELDLSPAAGGGVRLEMHPTAGASYCIEARRMEISLAPGIPPGSKYE